MLTAINRHSLWILLAGILFLAADLFPSVQLCSMGLGCEMPVQKSCCEKDSGGKTISLESKSCCTSVTISKLETEKLTTESSVSTALSVVSTELPVLTIASVPVQTPVLVLPGSPPPVYLSCKVFLI